MKIQTTSSKNFFLIYCCCLVFGLGFLVISTSISKVWADSRGNFVKKEIFFLKWGVSTDEVGFSKKVEASQTVVRGRTIPARINYHYPSFFQVDRDGDFQIVDSVNHRVLAFDQKGKFLRSVPTDDSGVKDIDEAGDIYISAESKDLKTSRVTRISKNGKKANYTVPFNWYVSGNKFVDSKGKTLFTMEDKEDHDHDTNPLFLERFEDFEYQPGAKEVRIKISKINNLLRLHGQKSNFKDLVLPIVQRQGLAYNYPVIEVLGVDNHGSIYLYYQYYSKNGSGMSDGPGGVQEEDVYVYSADGVLQETIPIPMNVFDNSLESNILRLKSNGTLYQMWVSNEGIHIFQWSSR